MKLRKEENSFYFTEKKDFIPNLIPDNYLENAFNFAYDMSFGSGHHRAHRSGGQQNRSKIEIFRNTFQGKLAEIVVFHFFKEKEIIFNDVDYSVTGKGNWDDSDLIFKEIKISVKSAAFFSNLLLLETKDWDDKANYIPNLNAEETTKNYDYHILVRIKPNTNSLFNDSIDKKSLEDEIKSKQWYYDIPGCCSNNTLKHIIQNNYILPQNSLLNGKVKMDAENYYIQAGDLKDISELTKRLNNL